MKDKATPRPWTLLTPPGAGREICAILGMDEKVRNFVEYMVRGDVPVPLFTSVWVRFPSKEYQEMQDANAELIVRAVNSHDELVEALEIISKIAYDVPWSKYDEFNLQSLWLAIEQARAALKKQSHEGN